jgi:hypothetical protein
MKFVELHEHIPLARYGKPKSLTMEPYKGITLAMPGRHAEDTTPKGGDFVVMVTDAGIEWRKHQFKHDDIFFDVERRAAVNAVEGIMNDYLKVIALGEDPNKSVGWPTPDGCINSTLFLQAIQCLAVAEHRRYSQHEEKFGGRFLPFRFAAGIAQGLWTAEECVKVQRYGRPAVERLEKNKGRPSLTQKLFDTKP